MAFATGHWQFGMKQETKSGANAKWRPAKLPSLPKFQILSIDNNHCPGEALPHAPLHPRLGSHANLEWGAFLLEIGIKEKHS